MLDIHHKYGDVVRIAPNELSFYSPQSYQDIYGHVSKGRGRFCKNISSRLFTCICGRKAHPEEPDLRCFAFVIDESKFGD